MKKEQTLKAAKKDAGRKIRLDISGYDRTTIIWLIRSAYRQGYNEILVHYDNTETTHLRKSGKLLVRDIIRDESVRSLGARVEMLDAHNSMMHVEHQPGNPDEIIKRVIRKLIDQHAEFILLAKGHIYAAALIEEKHDSLTKLLTYCQVLLTKEPHHVKDSIAYHLLGSVDKIADIIKYMGRDYTIAERPMSKTSIALFEQVQDYLLLYERVHARRQQKDIVQLMVKRDDIKRRMRDTMKTLSPNEAFLMGQETAVIEILADMFESSIALGVGER